MDPCRHSPTFDVLYEEPFQMAKYYFYSTFSVSYQAAFQLLLVKVVNINTSSSG